MSADPMRALNLVTGTLALVAVLGVTGWLVLRKVFAPAPETVQVYVAYFDDAGGIRAGDRVRLKGRTAGRVLDVRIVQRDGRTQARVEFQIAPGEGSQWLNDQNLPMDTEVRIQRPRLMGGTQLAISPGSSRQEIPDGGEVRKVVNDRGTDQLTEWKQQLQDFNREADQVLRFAEGDLLLRIVKGVAEVNRRAQEFLSMLDRGFANAAAIEQKLVESSAQMEEVRVDIRRAMESMPGQVKAADDQVTRLADAVGNAAARLADLGEAVGRAGQGVSSLVQSTGSPGTADAGRGLRRFSAQLRESMRVGVLDPKQAGDMPTWRKLRKYYHGDTFQPNDPKLKMEDD
ncbi:MAG: MCE family protein [Planctomycetes bacterium]|nr:MCE family protein [Planctomycetota bacterium]